MSDDHSSEQTIHSSCKRLPKKSTRSLLPSFLAGFKTDSSPRTQSTNDSGNRMKIPSSTSSSSSRSRSQQASRDHSSIQMEPILQALLEAESRAARMIVEARTKRNKLMHQLNQLSQAEIEAFRQQREAQYKIKLHESNRVERFQTKLNAKTRYLLNQMEASVTKERKSMVDYIIHCVIDEISVERHRNTIPVTEKNDFLTPEQQITPREVDFYFAS